MTNPFKYGSQNYKILNHLNMYGEITLGQIVSMGIMQYNVRIKEIRAKAIKQGYIIENIPGKKFILKKIENEEGNGLMF